MHPANEDQMILYVLAVMALFGATGAAFALKEGVRLGWGLSFNLTMAGNTLFLCGLAYVAAFF